MTQFELGVPRTAFLKLPIPWNISFARRFHGQINLDKAHTVFSFLVLHIAQLGTTVRNLDVSVNEIIDVTTVRVGWRQRGLIFITVSSVEVVKALPGSSEHFLMGLDVILSVYVS